ncbi:MAG: endonuclease/exonuclease/phosphatase family protein [Verrucomicrobiota bacterium]
MPAFPKPKFAFDYDPATEIKALHDYQIAKPDRKIPTKSAKNLLIATWNIANLGLQQRRESDYKIIAEMLGWFDVVAVQEVNDDLSGWRGIQKFLPKTYRAILSNSAGNKERMAFVYDSNKISPLEKIGIVTIPPADQANIKIEGVTQEFRGFDRSPFLASFQTGNFTFLLVGVHLYFGDDAEKISIERRCLEAYAVGRWADLRRKSKNAFTPNIITLGDFNLPKVEPGNAIYKALTSRGLELPPHSTKIGSSVVSDAQYDQVGFFPGAVKDNFMQAGVFDFDGALFRKLWDPADKKNAKFFDYMKYYMSDHRILWTEFKL